MKKRLCMIIFSCIFSYAVANKSKKKVITSSKKTHTTHREIHHALNEEAPRKHDKQLRKPISYAFMKCLLGWDGIIED